MFLETVPIRQEAANTGTTALETEYRLCRRQQIQEFTILYTVPIMQEAENTGTTALGTECRLCRRQQTQESTFLENSAE